MSAPAMRFFGATSRLVTSHPLRPRAPSSSASRFLATTPSLRSDQLHHPHNPQASAPSSTPGPPSKKMFMIKNIAAEPSEHTEFRTVVWTGESSQLVLMSVPTKGEIGEETHHVDQHLFFTSGKGKAIVGGEEKEVEAGDLVIVPQGTLHNFINTGPTPLTLYTVYAPAEHAPTSVHRTKEEGDKAEDQGVDEPPKWASN